MLSFTYVYPYVDSSANNEAIQPATAANIMIKTVLFTLFYLRVSLFRLVDQQRSNTNSNGRQCHDLRIRYISILIIIFFLTMLYFTYVYPYVDSSANKEAIQPATAASMAGIPWRLLTPQVSWILSLLDKKGWNRNWKMLKFFNFLLDPLLYRKKSIGFSLCVCGIFCLSVDWDTRRQSIYVTLVLKEKKIRTKWSLGSFVFFK